MIEVRPYLLDLIRRIALDEGQISSAQSVSWHAHREAEKLDDISMIPELQTFLSGKTRKDERSAVYFILVVRQIRSES